MKKIICLIVFLFCLLLNSSLLVWADSSLVPPMSIGASKLKVNGHAQLSYNHNLDSVDLGSLDIRLKLDTPTLFSVFSEVDLADLDKSENNWLRQLWVSYQHGNTSIRFGRLFTAAGFSMPPPFLLKTARRMSSNPFAIYAYGIQMDGKYGKLRVVADITEASGKTFRDNENLGRTEFSGRVEYKVSDPLSMALTTQLNGDFQRYGFDVEYKVYTDVVLNSGVYFTDKENRNIKSGFLLADWKLNNYLHLHSQIDHFSFGGNNVIWTNGFQVFARENASLTLDYESRVEGKRDNNLLVRLQFLF